MIEPDFAAALSRLCREHDVMLIADEVQTGLARTGSLYAYQQTQLKPDIVTLSKPLAGGLPLSATLIPGKVNDLLHVGEHGTTFGGGPVTTAVGLQVWNILSRTGFMEDVTRKGQYLAGKLQDLKSKHPFLGRIKGRGLLVGLEINEYDVSDVMTKAQAAGLLVLRSGANILRMAPPLVISEEEIDQGLAILADIFAGF